MPAGYNQERSAGAGRFIDVFWPGIQIFSAQNTVVNPSTIPAQIRGGDAPLGNTIGQIISGSGPCQVEHFPLYRGRPALVCRPGTGAAGTGIQVFFDPMAVAPVIGAAATQLDESDTDQMLCYRAYGILQIEPPDSFNVSTGLSWSAPNAGDYNISNGAAGFMFAISATGEIVFVRRDGIGGAVVVDALDGVLGAGVLWRSYEVRIIGAKPSHNSLLKVYINGKLLRTYDWITNGLCNCVSNVGTYGLKMSVQSRGAGVNGANTGVAINRLHASWAPTESDLL
jgi:hypothetical protein